MGRRKGRRRLEQTFKNSEQSMSVGSISGGSVSEDEQVACSIFCQTSSNISSESLKTFFNDQT